MGNNMIKQWANDIPAARKPILNVNVLSYRLRIHYGWNNCMACNLYFPNCRHKASLHRCILEARISIRRFQNHGPYPSIQYVDNDCLDWLAPDINALELRLNPKLYLLNQSFSFSFMLFFIDWTLIMIRIKA